MVLFDVNYMKMLNSKELQTLEKKTYKTIIFTFLSYITVHLTETFLSSELEIYCAV